jgi:DNA-binding NtrC family response regulator
MGITSDITQRKEGERALHESAARMAAAMDVAELGYYEVLNGVHVSFADEQAREILGWSEADAKAGRILEFWSEHLHPEDGASILEVNRSLNEGERDRITVDYRFLHPERGVLHIHHLAHVIERDAGGHALRTIGVLKDITERMRTEDALRSRELRLASATEIAGLGFYELREGRRVAFLDPRGRDLLGVPPEEEDRIREYWLSRISPEDQPLVASAIRRGLEEGRELGVLEYRYLHPTRGEIWLHHFSRIVEREPSGGAIRTVGVFQDVTERKRAEQDLRQALDEVRQLRDRLQNENVYLREQIRVETGHGAIVGESEPVQKMLRLAARVAPTDSAVLITGETGTGKELLAQAIHDQSARKAKTMVKVNCAALPAPLIESELFGREKGAYTGAMTQQIGRFELADGSTIFLDEIGDLPLDLQSKLLRVLQDGRFERLGGTRTVKADVRVIAATNRDLASMVKAGTFREDLFHRLNVFPIEAPPLRARASDIPTLTWTFVQELNARMGRTIDAIPKATMEALKRYPWPGNVRELRNVLERAMIVSDGRSLAVELPETDPAAAEAGLSTLEDVERRHIRDVLERTRWRISGKGGAAEVLGLIPTTLHSRMKKLGITRPGQRAYLFGGAG